MRRRFECQFCKEKFGTKGTLNRHLKNKNVKCNADWMKLNKVKEIKADSKKTCVTPKEISERENDFFTVKSSDKEKEA